MPPAPLPCHGHICIADRYFIQGDHIEKRSTLRNSISSQPGVQIRENCWVTRTNMSGVIIKREQEEGNRTLNGSIAKFSQLMVLRVIYFGVKHQLSRKTYNEKQNCPPFLTLITGRHFKLGRLLRLPPRRAVC